MKESQSWIYLGLISLLLITVMTVIIYTLLFLLHNQGGP